MRPGFRRCCRVVTVTPPAAAPTLLECLHQAIAETQRPLHLDDLRADRGVMDIIDAADAVIADAPAPIAIVNCKRVI